jgi:cytoskeletal protein RodZ
MLNYFNNRHKKGQSTLEYAILIIIIIGALLSIQVYIKRGVQGRLKQAADDIGDQFSSGNQKTSLVTSVTSQTNDTFAAGKTRSQITGAEVTSVIGSSNILNVEQEYWGT